MLIYFDICVFVLFHLAGSDTVQQIIRMQQYGFVSGRLQNHI